MTKSLIGQLLLLGGIVGTTTTIGGILLSQSVSADNSTADNVSITVPSACTLGGTIASGQEHTATIISGQHKANIGTTTITAVCNDANGFAIYSVGASNGDDGNTRLLSDINPNSDIHTGTTMAGDVSAWAMKLTNLSGDYPLTLVSAFDNVLHEIPSSYTMVAYRAPTTGNDYAGTDDAGAKMTTTYDVYASTTQQAGTYMGQVRYAMLHPYSGSEGLVFINTAYQKAGKMKATALDGKEYYKMQDMDANICGSINVIGEASQTKLVDIRDGKTYYVTKLEDGNCWMTQNLDLDLTSGVALTSETTNLTVSGTAPYVDGYTNSGGVISWTPQDWEATTGATISATTRTPNGSGGFDNWVNGVETGTEAYKDGFVHPLSANPGDYYQNGVYFESIACNYLAAICSNFSTTPYLSNGEHGHVGNYYNYTAAVASNNTSGIANVVNADNSICPKGWILPVIGDYGELNILYNNGSSSYAGGDIGLFNAPLYLVRAGDVNGGTLRSTGYYGLYWQGTVANARDAYYLDFTSDRAVPNQSSYGRWAGDSIRCLSSGSQE